MERGHFLNDRAPDLAGRQRIATRGLGPVAIALVLLAVLGCLVVAERYWDRVRTESRERDRLLDNANVVAKTVSGEIEATNRALESIRDALPRFVAQPAGVALLGERLATLASAMAGVRTFVVVDREGTIAASSRQELVGMNFRDSERYATIRANPDASLLYVSAPFRTPLGNWSVSFGRMLTDAEGRFDGYVLAILDPAYLDEVVRAVLYAPDMRAGVIHSDGRFVLQIPPLGAAGLDVSADPEAVAMRHLRSGQEATVIEAVTAADRQRRVVATRNVRPPQARTDKFLFVGLSRETAAVYERWRSRTAAVVGLFAAFSLLTLTGAWLLQRSRSAEATSAAALEDERERSDRALREAEERWRGALEGSGHGVWDWDVAGGRIYRSPKYLELLGYGPNDLADGDAWAFTQMHPEDEPAVRAALDDHFSGRTPAYHAEFRMRHKDGHYGWVDSRGKVVEWTAEGKPKRMIGTHADSSARKEAEEALRTLTQDLEAQVAERTAQLTAAAAAKSEFLAHMSHEIRTPMNGVIGVTQLLKHEPLTADQHELVRTIEEAGDALLRIINDILDFSKIEAGQLQIECQPFALGAVLARVENLLRPSALAKGIGLSIAAPPGELPPVVGDALRLEQVLVNLLNNAIKFTRQGRVALTVGVQEETADGVRLRFEVQDTGMGIASETLERLFAPFTQADNAIARRFGGTGLGLAICKRVVELMGGRIGATSEEGRGSTFWFELPLARAGEPAAAAGPAVPAPAAEPRLAGLRVLAADDSRVNLLVVDRNLRKEGATVALAADGQQALQMLRAQPQAFDVVLMDVQMPVLDGLAATREIRADPNLAGLPVVALTAGVLPEERARALAAGVDDFLAKPLDVKQMVRVLRDLRDGRSRRG